MWLIALVIGISVVVGALHGSFNAGRRLQGMRRVFGVLGGILLATGFAAFFSTMLASLGVIPASFEWPVGRADQIIQMQDGLHRQAVFRSTTLRGTLCVPGTLMQQVEYSKRS
jgi:hypothetical protein